MNKKNPFIDTKRELGTLEDLKYEHDKTRKLNAEFGDAYLKTFVCLSRGNGKSGKILREVIERTGYLDEC